MPTILGNKREVRDYVKHALQSCVDDCLLDVEDQKSLIKSVAEAVDVPVEDQAVGAVVYKHVCDHVTLTEVPDSTAAQVKARLASLTPISKAGTETAAAEPNGNGSAPVQGSTSTSTTKTSDEKKPSLSLSGLKARLAKRREEIQRPSSQTTTAAAEPHAERVPSLSAPRDVSNTETAEHDRVSLADGTESYRPTAPATANVSPAMGPRTAVVSPQPVMNEDGSGNDELPDAQSSHLASEPPTKRERVEVVLTAAPIEEEDLYAGLPLYQPRGRGIGGYRGRGRGGRGFGPAPYWAPPPSPSMPWFGRGRAGGPHPDAHAPLPQHSYQPPHVREPYVHGPPQGARGRGYGGPYQPPFHPTPAPYRGRYPS